MLYAETRSPSSVRRGGTTPSIRLQAKNYIEQMGGPVANRRSRPQGQHLPRQAASSYIAEEEYDTEDDQALQRGLRRRQVRDPQTNGKRVADGGVRGGQRDNVCREWKLPRRRRFHPLFWWGVAAILFLCLGWFSTGGLALWSHVTDLGYGPTRGNSITGVFGGGDSATVPTKILAMNDNGRVELLIIPASDATKARLMSGPKLAALNFPDPRQAVIDLQTGDYNSDGTLDLRITVYADMYDFPFHRYNVTFYLYGDGSGNLKQTL
jgi:hypothetical protein